MAFLTDEWALVGVVDADANTAGTALTAAIDMSKFHELAVLVAVGDLGTSATVDCNITASATSGGTYNTTGITTKAITQLTQAGTDKSNTQSWIMLKSDEMPAGKRYVKVAYITATATSDGAMYVFGRPRYYPPTDVDLTTVNEVINA